MAGLLGKLLDFPAFLLGFTFLYWSLPISALLGKFSCWRFQGKVNYPYDWAKGLCDLFRVKLLLLPGPQKYRGGPCMFLANHRCWADFFIDVVLSEGNAQMLSRMAVYYVFPMFMISVRAAKGVILFKRGRQHDKDAFNRMVDKKMARSPLEGLIIYPEGHRSTKQDSLPLKRGMLHYAFSRKLPMQIIMSSNKEAVLSEKKQSAHFGQKILVGYSDVIQTKDFASFEDMLAALQRAWDAQWLRVYSARLEEAVSSMPDRMDTIDYSRHDRLNQLGATALEGVCFLLAAALTFKAAAVILRASGSYWLWLLLGLGLWCSISAVRACQVVTPWAPSQQLRAAQQQLSSSHDGQRMLAAAQSHSIQAPPQ
ncbi:hypothetical protein WJX74_010643 [Apatococcus lobatus]|uniref:Phospholipid/glycerol acyltransferase domain-containing protein n=1 Tax=Apatococcus lobatus TaxID=904363 RepID=A0AAW1RQW8_9CHLO